MSRFVPVKPPFTPPPPPIVKCNYPRSYPTNAPITAVLQKIADGSYDACSFYLDTQESMSGGAEDHAQGIARTHQLSNKEIYWFLTYSEIGGEGQVSTYLYGGAVYQAHVVYSGDGNPLTVAPMQQRWLNLEKEDHPSDIAFLPDINNTDAGYLFITEEYQRHQVIVYYWKAGAETLQFVGVINGGFSNDGEAGCTGPQFVFIDLIEDTYYLGAASENWGWGQLFQAKPSELFPNCTEGGMCVEAFKPVPQSQIALRPDVESVPVAPTEAEGLFVFPVQGGPSQVKLVCDSLGLWYLLAFRSVPNDDPHGTDYIDAYPVRFQPFSISPPNPPVHVTFPPGDTGFASTGTHYVNSEGHLMVSTSFRWAEKIDSSGVGFVSRVDELYVI